LRPTFISLIFLICFSATAQEVELTEDSDTTSWLNWNRALADQLNIKPISESAYNSEFRYWDGFKVIRLWKEEGELKV